MTSPYTRSLVIYLPIYIQIIILTSPYTRSLVMIQFTDLIYVNTILSVLKYKD